MSQPSNKQIIKKICKEAQSIFVYTQSIEFGKIDPKEKFLIAQQTYPDFARRCPIPLLMMTDYNWFEKRAFSKWLENMLTRTSQGLEGFCEVQAEYAVLAYKKKNLHHGNLKDIYDQYYNLLLEEYNKLNQMQQKAKSESALEATKLAQERTDELYHLLINKK